MDKLLKILGIRKKHDYIILTASAAHDLERLVNSFIASGYTPLGGVTMNEFMYTSGASPQRQLGYAQALIKK